MQLLRHRIRYKIVRRIQLHQLVLLLKFLKRSTIFFLSRISLLLFTVHTFIDSSGLDAPRGEKKGKEEERACWHDLENPIECQRPRVSFPRSNPVSRARSPLWTRARARSRDTTKIEDRTPYSFLRKLSLMLHNLSTVKYETSKENWRFSSITKRRSLSRCDGLNGRA
ncbi:unnamed protein product [Xylocopa violacea]|uniref:Uncharacterized protein n=1 Tax=Xylocopa violacea TaxID=135666 RepID=A0ABP1NYB2_XYLVO